MNRFKRHVKSLLERVCKIAAQSAGNAQVTADADDQHENDTITEEGEGRGEEESDWIGNDQKTADNLLYKLN